MPHRAHRSLVTTTAALTAFALSLPSYAGPNGGIAVGGAAASQGAANGPASINQSRQNAIMNGNAFNTGAGETNQPNSFRDGAQSYDRRARAIADFRRVDRQRKGLIDKSDGIASGSGTIVNTAGFLASTGDLHTKDSMAGKDNCNIPGLPDASMLNFGNITATGGGFAGVGGARRAQRRHHHGDARDRGARGPATPSRWTSTATG